MSTEQAPECCPFCGAGIIIMADGRECRSRNQWVSFQCFTNWHRNYREPRKLQSSICEDGERRRLICERERLTRERDEARLERDQALMLLGVYKTKSGDLLARVKRLEDAGDAIVDHNIGCGCGQDGPCRACRMACEAWTKAKEATR